MINGQVVTEADDGADKTPANITRYTVKMTPRMPEFTDVVVPMSPLPLDAIGVTCTVPATIVAVEPNSPAAAAGIEPGDEIISEKLIWPPERKDSESGGDDSPPAAKKVEFGKWLSWPGFVLDILPAVDPDTKVQFEVKHSGQTREVEMKLVVIKDEQGNSVYSAQRGFNFAPVTVLRQVASLPEAIRAGGQETLENLLLVYRFLQKLGVGQVPITGLGGPVTIAEQAGLAAQQGLGKLLLFLTMLSANLAVINFLPIPVLDGGHMVFLLYEGIRGKPASERVVVGFTYAGLVFILSLMVFVLSLDLGLISRR